MADFISRVGVSVEDSTKTTGTGISKLVNDLKELRSGMNVGVTGLRNLQTQFKELGVNLNKSTLKSSISTINSDLLRYVTTSGQIVTVNRKIKNGLDTYTVSLKNVNKELKKGTSLWSAFTQGISGTIVKLRIMYDTMKNVAYRMADIVEGASEYEEAMNLFLVSMGDQAEGAMTWVEKFSTALYLDPANVMQYMGSLNSLISGLGVGADKSYLMSKNLTQLAYDLASFKNMSFEEAFTKLQSGISGEIEPLRNVGVALSQATLQELANSLGIQQRVAEMSEAEKAQLRYIQIIKSTTQWQGDMGRTLVSPANAVRVLREQFTLLGRAIGRVFLPIIMEVLPYVMALTQILTDLANKIASFLGYEFTDIDYSSLGNISSGLGDIGDEAESTTKKLNTMLAPFDELNVVQSKSQGAGNGLGSIGGDLGVDLPEYDALAGLTDKFKNNVESAKENLEKIFDIVSKIAAVFAGIWAVSKLATFTQFLGKLFGILPSGQTEFTGLAWIINSLSSRFKKGKTATNSFMGGIKAMFPWLTKTTVGSTTLVASLAGIYNVTKKTSSGMGEVTTGSKLLATGLSSVAMIAGGLLSGGLGILAGSLASIGIALIGIGKGYDEALTAKAKENLFGDLSVSAESFKNMLDSMSPSIDAASAEINEMTNTILETKESLDSSKSSLDNYLYLFSNMGDTIGGEYKEKFKSSLDSFFSDANDIVKTGNEQALLIVSNSLKNATSLTKEEQQEILTETSKNGKYLENKVSTIQDSIYNIYEKAMKERGYLNDEERKKIQALLDEVDKLTKNTVSQTETDLLLIKQQFSDRSLKLDEESYSKFAEARDAYIEEKEKAAKEEYNRAYNAAQTQYNLSLQQLKDNNKDTEEELDRIQKIKEKSEKAAFETYRKSQLEYESIVETTTESIVGDLRTRYQQIKDENDDLSKKEKSTIEGIFSDLNIDLNPIKKAANEAGAVAGMAFGSAYQIKLSQIKPQIPSSYKFNTDASGNITVVPRATGGFPKTGEFFIAREAGPEMVGKIGNQTAVANNDQITTSITNALITALNNYNFGSSQPSMTVVNIAGRKVYEGVGDYVDSENDRYGTNYVHV